MSTDLSFLRRRTRTAPAAAPAHTSAPVTPTSPVPQTTSGTTLTTEAPATRLSRYASGIGSLTIAGARTVVIELDDLTAFTLGRDTVRAYGNRPLAEHHEGHVVIGLRHIRHIRRVVMTGEDMSITTFAGLTVQVPGTSDLGIHVVAGHLELRRDEPRGDIAHTYRLGAPQ